MNIQHAVVVCAAFLVACPVVGGDTNASTDATVTDAGTRPGSGLLDANVDADVTPSSAFEAHFSPNGGCTNMIVKHIKQGKKIRMLAYTFTSSPIIQQLIASKNAGADVQVVLDRSDVGTSGLQQLQAASVSVKIDKTHVIAHNKVVVIDDHWVLTGSFNFTYAAEHQNAENCVAIDDKGLASQYTGNWDLHNGHSVVP